MESYSFRVDFHLTRADAIFGYIIADVGSVGPSFINHKFKKLYF